MKKWKHERLNCSDMCPTYGKLRDKIMKREALENSNTSDAANEANKTPSKFLGAGTDHKGSM